MAPDEIQQIFFQECEEGLAALEVSFQLCREGRHDDETINTIFRAVHSIKGGAGAFGKEALQHFAHHYENVLDRVRAKQLDLTPELLRTLVAAFDMLSDLVIAAREGKQAPDDQRCLDMLAKAGNSAVLANEDAISFDVVEVADLDALFEPLAAPVIDDWRVQYKPGGSFLANGGEPVLMIRAVEELGGEVVETDLSHLPELKLIDSSDAYLGWIFRVPGTVSEDEIGQVFDFASNDCEIVIGPWSDTAAPLREPTDTSLDTLSAPLPEASNTGLQLVEAVQNAAPSGTTPTVRIDLEKLERLVNLVGELVITQAMLAQRLTSHGLSASTELSDLDHLTRELQDSAMAIRAQPLKTVFSRVPRIIRELEADTGKQVRLRIEGEMTEVDRTIVERIGEPLTHMIRNAVDHGIELPADRLAAGKEAEGCITLSAEHRSGRIVISISDDGRGIDRARVLAKAMSQGIVSQDATLSEDDIDELIFAPGFSTAAAVTSISGRGVGMDVVRKNVQALGGRISIASRPGQGSTFTLSLPLTLAVLDGMTVKVGDEALVIPLSHIVESLRPTPEQVKRISPGKLVLDARGSFLPIHHVGSRLSVDGTEADPTKAVLIVVESDAGSAALMVDTIVDQRQVVVKSLDVNYAPVDSIAGATILGDGRVALILDVDGLVSLRRQDSWAPVHLRAAA